jgi:hypothetical protein
MPSTARSVVTQAGAFLKRADRGTDGGLLVGGTSGSISSGELPRTLRHG